MLSEEPARVTEYADGSRVSRLGQQLKRVDARCRINESHRSSTVQKRRVSNVRLKATAIAAFAERAIAFNHDMAEFTGPHGTSIYGVVHDNAESDAPTDCDDEKILNLGLAHDERFRDRKCVDVVVENNRRIERIREHACDRQLIPVHERRRGLPFGTRRHDAGQSEADADQRNIPRRKICAEAFDEFVDRIRSCRAHGRLEAAHDLAG
jgi:hypothetical protein